MCSYSLCIWHEFWKALELTSGTCVTRKSFCVNAMSIPPPRSKCSLCCSVSWWGGRGVGCWRFTPFSPDWGGTSIQSDADKVPPIGQIGFPPLARWGTLSARWRYPHQPNGGIPPQWEGWGYPPARKDRLPPGRSDGVLPQMWTD